MLNLNKNFNINSYLNFITNKNINKINNLIKQDRERYENNATFELYNSLLTPKHSKFIITKCSNYINNTLTLD